MDSERQLKTSSRFFDQILAGLTTGVLVFDKDWHLEQFNSSAQKILGLSLVNYLECPIDRIPIISEKKINFGDSFKQNNEHQQRVDAFREDGSKLSLIITAFLFQM